MEMGFCACQLFDGSTSTRLDAPTLEVVNTRMRAFLGDPTLDTPRLLNCAVLAGWDNTLSRFGPDCEERNLELLVHSLNDVQTILRLHTNKPEPTTGGRRRRASKDKTGHSSLLTQTLSKELLTKTLSKELVDGVLGRTKSRDQVSDQSAGPSCPSTNTSPALVGITETSPSQSMEFSESTASLTSTSPSLQSQSTHSSQQAGGSEASRTSSGTRATPSNNVTSIPAAEGRLSPTLSGMPGADAAEERLMAGLAHIVGNYEIEFNELEFEQGHMGAHNRMGIGGYGEVFLATWQGTEVAVKRLLDQDMGKLEVLEDFRAELDIQSRLRHANVVMWMGACTKPPNLAVVLEAIYSKTKHGPRGRSLHFILHKTAHNITWLQVRLSEGVSCRGGFRIPPRGYACFLCVGSARKPRAARRCLARRAIVGFRSAHMLPGQLHRISHLWVRVVLRVRFGLHTQLVETTAGASSYGQTVHPAQCSQLSAPWGVLGAGVELDGGHCQGPHLPALSQRHALRPEHQ